MTPDRWQIIQSAFERALRDGSAFLSTLSADVRDEVQRLLQQDELAEREGFLARPLPRPPVGLTGTRLGPYEVIERIGSGGMGEVYRAVRRDDYRQEVALKVVRAELGGEALQRFRTERQVLAELHHPNIARLLDGGTTADGRPFLVMELIAGQPIDRYAEAQSLPLRRRAELFLAVCRAVAHAHERGVVHRDLKPSNVLVGPDEAPRVTDFGLARRLEGDSGQTQTGQIIGTPTYMAPEQARGDAVGSGSDVYSLGALLYQLLVGRPPFRGDTARQTIELLLTTDPVAPRSVQPGVPRDLETICLKCLHKEPGRRYANAGELADDVARWLGGEPIRARPVGWAEKAWRWARRYPRVAALSAALLLAVTAGLATVTFFWLEADRQRRRAEAREKLARAAVDDLLRVAERALENAPRMTTTQLEVLQRALASYLELARDGGGDATLRFRTAQAHHFVARIHYRVGRPDLAEQEYREQLAILDALPQERKMRFDRFHAYLALRQVIHNQGRTDEGDRFGELALETIRALVADHPAEPLFQDALAHQLYVAGLIHSNRGDRARAAASFTEGAAAAEALVRRHPGRKALPDFRCNVHSNHLGLAGLAVAEERVDDAVAMYRRAIDVGREVARDHPEEPVYPLGLAHALWGVADILTSQGRAREALPLVEEGIELVRRPVADFPTMPQYRVSLASGLWRLGWVRHLTGEEAAARAAFREGLRIKEKITADFPTQAEHRDSLAWMHVTCPVPREADPGRGARLAREAAAAPVPHAGAWLALAVACLNEGDGAGCLRAAGRLPLHGLYRRERLILEGLGRLRCRDRAGAEWCLGQLRGGADRLAVSPDWVFLLERLRAAIMGAGMRSAQEKRP